MRNVLSKNGVHGSPAKLGPMTQNVGHTEMKQKAICVAALALLMIAPAARADVVWPAMFLETRLVTWWAISTGLVAEYLFVRPQM